MTGDQSPHPAIDVFDGDTCLCSFDLNQPGIDVTLGRDASNHLVIPHESISRQHARLRWEWSGAVTIIDIGSTNGITVNGRQLTQSIEIYPQDVIRLGSVRLAIRHLPDTDLDNRNAIQLRQKPSNTLRTEPGTVLKEKMPDDSDGKETVSDKDYPDMTRRNIRVAHLLLVGGCFLFLAGLLALYLLNSGK